MDFGDAASSSAKAEVVPSTLSESSPTELLNFSTSFDLKAGSVIILLKCSPKSDITSSGDAASSSFCPTTNWIAPSSGDAASSSFCSTTNWIAPSSGDASSSSFCPTTNWIESNKANENTTKETFAMFFFFYFLKRLSKEK
ncbi:hypothetical protein ES332_A01G011300v1 [Gossypium tomentosum]|uniref:Uncharacterized protein n=1 Tax=Gossypium tomentosum TaxID=34277 RepID=A0A5D2RN96_GOSTO|nr:hypothetical protein ES332_A01G011300v1 [Gossypium tomentosum]